MLKEVAGYTTAAPDSLTMITRIARGELRKNPNVVIVDERSQNGGSRSFAEQEEGIIVVETTRLMIAPQSPVSRREDLIRFLNTALKGVDIDSFDQSGGDILSDVLAQLGQVVLPRLQLSETLWTTQQTTTVTRAPVIFDGDAAERLHKSSGSEVKETTEEIDKSVRHVEVLVYPDVGLARLSRLYLEYIEKFNPQARGLVLFPPGTQNNLAQLARGLLSPQMISEWREMSAEDLMKSYFTPDGKIIPRFYRIPDKRTMEKARKQWEMGGLLPERFFTAPFKVKNGTPKGTKIQLWRTYKGLSFLDLARRIKDNNPGHGIHVSIISSIEKGNIDANPEQYRKIASGIGVSTEVLDALQV